MEDIAKAAGVGRATLYRHFSNRDELLMAVIERESKKIAAHIDVKIRHIENPGEHIIEGMVQAMRELRNSVLLSNIMDSQTSSIVNRLAFTSDRLVSIGLDIVMPVVQRAHDSGKLKTDLKFELLVEWVMRMLMSFLLAPSQQVKTEKDLRNLFRATLLPVLEG